MISHKLNEIAKVADKITVLRDGSTVETIDCRAGQISEEPHHQGHGRPRDDRALSAAPVDDRRRAVPIRDWRVEHPQHAGREVVKGVNLHVRRGEVVGIAGLMGAGRTELAMSVFGRAYGRNITRRGAAGGHRLELDDHRQRDRGGPRLCHRGPQDARTRSSTRTSSTTSRSPISTASPSGGVIDDAREVQVATRYRSALRIRTPSIHQRALNLSGGNQQKVVLSKWLFTEPKVLMLDEPTRGIDVGAKYEIYSIINDLAAQGKGVIVISSEMPELLGICDRIYVMNEGRFVDEMPAKEASQEKIMASIMRQYAGAFQ